MLWWVDLSYGLLACDPFDEEPRLLHVPLPQVPDEIPPNSRVNRGTRSCVQVCGGRLRYVQIHGDIEVPVVSTWVLIASTWCPGRWEWSPELSVPLAEVWVDETYLNTKLPLSIPAVAFLHPTNPDRVYFFLRSCIFAVDLQLRKVVEFNQFEMLDPPGEIGRKRSSRYVHAWQYDPASSTRSDFVSTCLRQEKAIPTRRSFSGFNPAMPATAKMMKRVWNTIARDRQQQQEEWQQRAMSCDFKRRCGISEGSRISLDHLSG